MCTFCKTSDLPSQDKNSKGVKKAFINFFLKPNKEGENYRFRLLFYRQPSKNDRKDPFIYQRIHDHWGTTETGKKIVDDLIVCPGTDYVHYDEKKFVINEKTGKNELNCPICRKAKENMQAWLNSGKTDKLSMQKFNQLKQKERLCVPVYVIHDPNTVNDDGEFVNDGQFKVLILTNKDDIKKFREVVEEEKTKAYLASKEGNTYEVFNGNNAVDLYVHYESIPEVRNQGQENEYTAQVRKITNIAFGKKTSHIEAITKEAIDKFEFDDQFYFSNTKEEIIAFYKKYYGVGDVAPDEEDVFGGNTEVVTDKKVIETENNIIETETYNSSKDEDIIDSVSVEIDDTPTPQETEDSIETDDLDELDKLLDDM